MHALKRITYKLKRKLSWFPLSPQRVISSKIAVLLFFSLSLSPVRNSLRVLTCKQSRTCCSLSWHHLLLKATAQCFSSLNRCATVSVALALSCVFSFLAFFLASNFAFMYMDHPGLSQFPPLEWPVSMSVFAQCHVCDRTGAWCVWPKKSVVFPLDFLKPLFRSHFVIV